MKKGIFITLEGPDGCGKTTIADLLEEELVKQGKEVVHTREPGGIDIAEQIRSVILDPKNTKMDARTEALLYAASRRQHLVERVIPALNDGKIIICERFLDSSIAYQGYGREIGAEEIIKINEFAIEGFMPAMTLFLDIDEEEGLKRIESRTFKDRLDQESIAFHHRVKQGYEAVKTLFPERIKIVDASKSIDEVKETCLKLILDKLNAN